MNWVSLTVFIAIAKSYQRLIAYLDLQPIIHYKSERSIPFVYIVLLLIAQNP